MSGAADSGAQKIALIFKPMLDELRKELKEHVTTCSQELLIAIGKVETRVDVLEKLVGEKKKSTTRGEKKTAGAAAVAADPNAATGTEVQVQQPAGAQKNFAVNKLVYFREQFKINPEYRAKYVTKEIQDLMDKEPTIVAKATEQQKLIAQATFCWNYFKANKPDVHEAIDKEYQTAKAAHEAANKPPQQVPDARTPPPATV